MTMTKPAFGQVWRYGDFPLMLVHRLEKEGAWCAVSIRESSKNSLLELCGGSSIT